MHSKELLSFRKCSRVESGSHFCPTHTHCTRAPAADASTRTPTPGRAAFNIPEDFIAGAVIALGYQGEPSTLPDDEFLAAEIAPRTRRPWNKSFLSAWDEPFNLG